MKYEATLEAIAASAHFLKVDDSIVQWKGIPNDASHPQAHTFLWVGADDATGQLHGRAIFFDPEQRVTLINGQGKFFATDNTHHSIEAYEGIGLTADRIMQTCGVDEVDILPR